MSGWKSIVNGAKDLLKAILLALLTYLAYIFLIRAVGPIMFYIALFLWFIAGILALIGIIRIVYGIITL